MEVCVFKQHDSYKGQSIYISSVCDHDMIKSKCFGVCFNMVSNVSRTCAGQYLNPKQGASIAAQHK